MARKDNTSETQFFELVRAGLFHGEAARILAHGAPVDWVEVYRIAEEQSVVGLISAGLDTLTSAGRPPQDVVLHFIGKSLQIEQQNKAMNEFVAKLIGLLRINDVYAVLVKGQGIAQCYEKSLWRASGDVDLLLDKENYEKAKSVLLPLASFVEKEDTNRKHLGLTIGEWVVELHGTLRSKLLPRLNKVVDEIQKMVFHNGKVRVWRNGEIDVYLPAPDEDVVFVFSHIIQHFWGEGIGLRQICDWCRLLWTYRESIDVPLLEQRVLKMGVMTEWKAFGSLAVAYLGMPVDAMPFYDIRFKTKGKRLLEFILETGNFGHNRDVGYRRGNVITRKVISFWRYTVDTIKRFRMFPMDSMKVWCKMVFRGLKME